jgi:hypothetical protein
LEQQSPAGGGFVVGRKERTYKYKQSVTVTLTAPWLTDVEIRYTLDGTEPSAASPLYEKPLLLSETRRLRTAAFRGQKLVSVPTSACFVRLPPRPAKPDVYLDDLKYVLDPYGQIAPVFAACLWQPKVGKSYESQPLRVRGKVYPKGLGFRAPSAVRNELKPEYDRFVALAGLADNMLDNESGRNLAMHCSVVFRAFIDGQQAAESPVMRISQEPWRFDVKIPPGTAYFLIQYLQETGRNDLLCTVFNQKTYPGLGYMLSQGATTFWEQWNGYWSQIHSCFTSPGGWFYQGLAGIRPDETAPGFKQIVIKPAVVGDLTWVKCSYDSIHGRIVSNWKKDGDKLNMEVTIPANTTASVFVPTKDAAGVTESGKPAAPAEGVKFLRMENNAAVYAVGSGTYLFRSMLPKAIK